jgi:hypothetical protein
MPSRRSVRARGLQALVVVLALGASACSSAPGAPASAVQTTPPNGLATPPPLQPDDLVDLTIYLREGDGPSARLEPVVREVPVSDDLPRLAVELLLAGPNEDEEGLEAPLPTSTVLQDLVIEGAVATVDLSADVLRDAAAVEASPANEALALAAIANTLTEFTSIEEVVITVDGGRDADAAAFWGGWGLPEVLVRDETVIGAAQAEGEGVVELTRFSAEEQSTGSSTSAPVEVAGVRVRDRITHTRFVIELVDPDDGVATVPVVRVRRVGGDERDGPADVSPTSGSALGGDEPTALDVDPDDFDGARVALDPVAGTLTLTVEPAAPRDHWLHSLTNPTRIILDVRKSAPSKDAPRD